MEPGESWTRTLNANVNKIILLFMFNSIHYKKVTGVLSVCLEICCVCITQNLTNRFGSPLHGSFFFEVKVRIIIILIRVMFNIFTFRFQSILHEKCQTFSSNDSDYVVQTIKYLFSTKLYHTIIIHIVKQINIIFFKSFEFFYFHFIYLYARY